MQATCVLRGGAVGVERTIEQQVRQRTWGRIHRLQVEVIEDRVVLHGQTSSYYIKQMALQGALEVIDPRQASRIEMNIQVGGCPTYSVHGLLENAGSIA